MASSSAPTPGPEPGYKMGYSSRTLSMHQRRTADNYAAFLLPHLRPGDRVLDVGCGPGTITVGFCRHVGPAGRVTGVDISDAVLDRARAEAASAGCLLGGAPDDNNNNNNDKDEQQQQQKQQQEAGGKVDFVQGDVLGTLPFPDGAFDVVFASQVFGHLPPSTDQPRCALAEMRRVLRPGGLLATRDGLWGYFYPRRLGLDRLWRGNFDRIIRGGAEDPDPEADSTGPSMPALVRAAGFGGGGGGGEGEGEEEETTTTMTTTTTTTTTTGGEGKLRFGAAAETFATPEERGWLAARALGQLQPGDRFHRSWLDAGIPEAEIDEARAAIQAWAATPDAYYATMHGEILAWK